MGNIALYDPVTESTSRLLFYLKDSDKLLREFPEKFTQEYLESVKAELSRRNLPIRNGPPS